MTTPKQVLDNYPLPSGYYYRVNLKEPVAHAAVLIMKKRFIFSDKRVARHAIFPMYSDSDQKEEARDLARFLRNTIPFLR